MKTGIELITIERQEQIEKHNRTTERNVNENPGGRLIIAAMALIRSETRGFYNEMPISWDDKLCKKMCKKSYKERLIIAGALIAAEIDRLQTLNNQRYEKGM
jgi:hypothetical protein